VRAAIGCYLKRKRRLSERVNPEGRALGKQTSAIVAYCACCVRDRRIYGANIRIVPGRPARPCKTASVRPPSWGRTFGQRKNPPVRAGKTIDKIADPAAHPEERAERRRRLTKGPEEFREVRVDRPKI
jgi:hypothetical protein